MSQIIPRFSALRCLAAALFVVLSTLPATGSDRFGWLPLQDWPLGSCLDSKLASAHRICLDASSIWQAFGVGAPEIEVAVVETQATDGIQQVLVQHPWLGRQDIPTFWHDRTKDNVRHVVLEKLPERKSPKERYGYLVEFCRENEHAGPLCAEENADQSRSLAYLTWRNENSHELQMIGLIAGQDANSLRRTGLTPFTRISLHYVGTNPSLEALQSLKRRLDLRPGTRVVNYSNEGAQGEFLDRQYSRIYSAAVAVNANLLDKTGEDPSDRLFLASSANSNGVYVETRMRVRPHRLLPPEAMVGGRNAQSGTETKLRYPAIAYELRRPEVPVLVVGGISADGRLYGEARIEPMIDLYAPGGMTPQQLQRYGRSSDFEDAEAVREEIKAYQTCEGNPDELSFAGVPTLDWGPLDDVRSGEYAALLQRARLHAAAFGADRSLGCLSTLVDKLVNEGDERTAAQLAEAVSQVADSIYFAKARGNSVSTAIVSAVAAQMFALDPQLSARDAARILRETARANRVYGLPVLDAKAALSAVVQGFVNRYIGDTLKSRLTEKASDLRASPHRVSSGAASREIHFALEPGTIEVSSKAPNGFAQKAWFNAAEDFPLRIRFVAQAPDMACRLEVTLDTETIRQANRTVRLVRSERIRSLPKGGYRICS